MKATFTSRALDWAGRLFIGSPASLEIDDEDFYYLPCDRNPPGLDELDEANVQRELIAVDAFRRELTERLAYVAAGVALAACAAGLILNAIFHAAANAVT